MLPSARRCSSNGPTVFFADRSVRRPSRALTTLFSENLDAACERETERLALSAPSARRPDGQHVHVAPCVLNAARRKSSVLGMMRAGRGFRNNLLHVSRSPASTSSSARSDCSSLDVDSGKVEALAVLGLEHFGCRTFPLGDDQRIRGQDMVRPVVAKTPRTPVRAVDQRHASPPLWGRRARAPCACRCW